MSDGPGNWGKWGAGDERGTLNYITEEKVRRAAGLVKTGKVYPLAIPLKAKAPIWPGRHENWHVATYANTRGPDLGGAEDILMCHTHGSTHIDALSHIYVDGKMYNDVDADAALDQRGAAKNAITNIGGIVTRGVLVDVAAHHGVAHLPADHVISAEEVETVALAQGISFESGDAILFRTGWITTWDTNRESFNKRQPGIGLDMAHWAGENEIAVMAADNAAVEAYPIEGELLPVHREFLRNQGGYLMELLDLESLAVDSVYEFQFIVAPLNITRGIGSPVTPLAVC